MPTPVSPLVLPASGEDPRRLQAGEVLAGQARWQELLPLQPNGLVTTALGVEVLIGGSDFVWTAEYLPFGRSLYLETYGLGQLASTVLVTQLYALTGPDAGKPVSGARTSTSATGGQLVRSAAFSLSEGVAYQLRFQSTIAGTGTLKLARLIIA